MSHEVLIPVPHSEQTPDVLPVRSCPHFRQWPLGQPASLASSAAGIPIPRSGSHRGFRPRQGFMLHVAVRPPMFRRVPLGDQAAGKPRGCPGKTGNVAAGRRRNNAGIIVSPTSKRRRPPGRRPCSCLPFPARRFSDVVEKHGCPIFSEGGGWMITRTPRNAG